MATINITLPADGETADVADYNSPLNTIVNEFNGNIDNTNIKSAAAIATSKLATDAGIATGMIADSAVTPAKLLTGTGADWAWDSWTPTLSGRLDDADWTKSCKYIQIGKIVHFTFKLTATAAAPMGGGTADCIFTLPVTAATGYIGTDQSALIGVGGLYDASGALFMASVGINSSNYTTARIRYTDGSGGLSPLSSTAPFTWTTSDEITVSGTYEAA